MTQPPVPIDPADAFPYGEEQTRRYQAARGGKRHPFLLFIPLPSDREHDRFLPFADIRMTEARKDGRELYIEFSSTVVILTGTGLRPVACAVAAQLCSRLEAFDPQLRDLPTDKTAPFIVRIQYYTRNGRKDGAEPALTQPALEPH